MKKFPLYKQYDAMDCGPTCLRMVSKHYGRDYTMDTLRQKSGIDREGVSLLGISEIAKEIEFRYTVYLFQHLTFLHLMNDNSFSNRSFKLELTEI